MDKELQLNDNNLDINIEISDVEHIEDFDATGNSIIVLPMENSTFPDTSKTTSNSLILVNATQKSAPIDVDGNQHDNAASSNSS